MADGQSKAENVFSEERIRSLIDLMKEHDLTEIDLRQDTQQIRLARAVAAPVNTVAVPVAAPIAPVAQPAQSGTPTPSSLDDNNPNIVTIKSPMVGTFYSRPNPNAKNFVEVGAHVQPDSVVCIIEAMKVFNEIPAEIRGRIVAVLVQNEESVEFGKPLFKVDTRA
jgi:acetyl-CoA carboxylase biotin carboxyl carrier protein